jgi:RNA polymerase sigma-70 factor, ECF subfamily
MAAETLESLFDRCQARLYRLACRMVSDTEEARDLVQETFLRAARRSAVLRHGPQPAEAWLFRILINLCRDHYRRSAVRAQWAGRNIETPAPSPDP